MTSGFNKKILLALLCSSSSLLFAIDENPAVPAAITQSSQNSQVQKESLEKFIATMGAQKEDAAKVQEFLNLFDKIIDGLSAGGEELSKIAAPFYDLCAMLVNADVSNPQNAKDIRAKLKEISLLINNDKVAAGSKITSTSAGNNVINNLSSFITLFEEMLGNPNVNGFFTNITQFINQYTYGKAIVATAASVVAASLGTLIVWRIIKRKGTSTPTTSNSIVNPTPGTTTSVTTNPTASSKNIEIEMKEFVDLAPKKSEEKQPVITTNTTPVVTTAPVVPTTPQVVNKVDANANSGATKTPTEVSQPAKVDETPKVEPQLPKEQPVLNTVVTGEPKQPEATTNNPAIPTAPVITTPANPVVTTATTDAGSVTTPANPVVTTNTPAENYVTKHGRKTRTPKRFGQNKR